MGQACSFGNLLIAASTGQRMSPFFGALVHLMVPGGGWAWDSLAAGFNNIDGISLAAADDGSITVVWGISDYSRPIDQRGEAIVANWIPGPGTTSIETLTSGYKSVDVNRAGVVVSGDGQTKAAAWLTRKDVAHMTDPDRGVFYSQVNTARAIYLPLVRQ